MVDPLGRASAWKDNGRSVRGRDVLAETDGSSADPA
jgi:hypothetical protein